MGPGKKWRAKKWHRVRPGGRGRPYLYVSLREMDGEVRVFRGPKGEINAFPNDRGTNKRKDRGP